MTLVDFTTTIAAKVWVAPGYRSEWPIREVDWEILSEDRQHEIQTEIDGLLCAFGRHDYVSVDYIPDIGYQLRCRCGATKLVRE